METRPEREVQDEPAEDQPAEDQPAEDQSAEDQSARDQVTECWRTFGRDRDPGARDRLVLHYAPLVTSVVRRVRTGLPSFVDQSDLAGDGVMGLMDAIDKFDTDRGLQFKTYAVPRIRGAVLDGLRASDWVPRPVRERMRDVGAALALLEQRLGCVPSDRELATELDITPTALRRIYTESSYTQLRSTSVADWAEEAPGPRTSPEDPEGDVPDGFATSLRALPERDQVLLALYYWEGLSFSEIAQVLGVGDSRISQLHGRAILRLRVRLARAATRSD